MYESQYKKIAKLDKKQQSLLNEAAKMEQEALKLKRDIRKIRIIKKPSIGEYGTQPYKYEILCYCGVPYKTRKDPDAEIREQRPQCPKCKIRVETKK